MAGTRRTLEIVCTAVGLDAGNAELLRLGENAIYRLCSAPLVARIARTIQYLPAELAGPSGQPVIADGRLVTFWELVSEQTEYGTVAELAVPLPAREPMRPERDSNARPTA